MTSAAQCETCSNVATFLERLVHFLRTHQGDERFEYASGRRISRVLIDDRERVVEETPADSLEALTIKAVTADNERGVVRVRVPPDRFVVAHGSIVTIVSQTTPPDEKTVLRIQFQAGRELRFQGGRVAIADVTSFTGGE